MLYYWLLFFFVTVFAKVLLAMVMIYLLLPTDRCCGECGGETLLIEDHLLVRLVTRWRPGRLQRRWCPACSRMAFARPPFGRRDSGSRRGAPRPVHVPDVDHR